MSQQVCNKNYGLETCSLCVVSQDAACKADGDDGIDRVAAEGKHACSPHRRAR